MSQAVPTVIIDYGHEPKAHKLRGFAEVAGVEDFIVDPRDKEGVFKKVENCFDKNDSIRELLNIRMESINKLVNDSFDVLKSVIT